MQYQIEKPIIKNSYNYKSLDDFRDRTDYSTSSSLLQSLVDTFVYKHVHYSARNSMEAVSRSEEHLDEYYELLQRDPEFVAVEFGWVDIEDDDLESLEHRCLITKTYCDYYAIELENPLRVDSTIRDAIGTNTREIDILNELGKTLLNIPLNQWTSEQIGEVIYEMETCYNFINVRTGETSNSEDWDDLCFDQGIDTTAEVYEWYYVSDTLYRELKKEGQVVTDRYDGYIWGRQTSGQAISLDGAIVRIAISAGCMNFVAPRSELDKLMSVEEKDRVGEIQQCPSDPGVWFIHTYNKDNSEIFRCVRLIRKIYDDDLIFISEFDGTIRFAVKTPE